MTPAGIDSSSSGPSCANTSNPTTDALPVRSYTYAGSTTFCIQVPMLLANEPAHMRRKSGYASAARALPGRKPWSIVSTRCCELGCCELGVLLMKS